MGVSSSKQPKTTKKVATQKVETAAKTGILSLTGHGISEVPSAVWAIDKMTMLDLTQNSISQLPAAIGGLRLLKTLKLDGNSLTGLPDMTGLAKLSTFSATDNKLDASALSQLPGTLTKLLVSKNAVSNMDGIMRMTKLQVLELSSNAITVVPESVGELVALVDLQLDDNQIEVVPAEIGACKRLKIVSLNRNRITGEVTDDFQPLPERLFAETPLERLNLEGNAITRRQLNSFKGIDTWLERRAATKSKDLVGRPRAGRVDGRPGGHSTTPPLAPRGFLTR